jgi:tetratricopeptide (TPR) repeat protein
MTTPAHAPAAKSGAYQEHLRVAEDGNAAALRGDHQTALSRYREAIRLAVQHRAPEVFFRCYMEATLESLELMEEFASVIEYCDRATAHYAAQPPAHDVAWLDLASIHQRKGAVLLKMGDHGAAGHELEQALAIGARIGARLELARLLRGWIARSFFVSKDRITQEQRRLHYFSVRQTRGPALVAQPFRAADGGPGQA